MINFDNTPFNPNEVTKQQSVQRVQELFTQACEFIGKQVHIKSHPDYPLTVSSVKIYTDDVYYGSVYKRYSVKFECIRFNKSSQSFTTETFPSQVLELHIKE